MSYVFSTCRDRSESLTCVSKEICVPVIAKRSSLDDKLLKGSAAIGNYVADILSRIKRAGSTDDLPKI